MRLVDYQNIANLIVSSGVGINLWCYYYVNPNCLQYMIPIIFIHFCGDLYFAQRDIKIHHLFGIILIVYKYVMKVNPEDDFFVILTLYKTELSTFFYVFRFYLDTNLVKKRIKHINDILFFASFFKFRIYDYFCNVIVNETLHMNMLKYKYNFFYFIGSHGMFLLNIYWCMLLCRVACKSIVKSISKIDWKTQTAVSYTMFLNIIAGGYIYSFFPQEQNVFDMTGLLLLSMVSYKYHNSCARQLKEQNHFEYTSDSVMYYYLMDIGSIHLRGFLCVLTGYYHKSNTEILLSFFIHTIGYVLSLLYTYQTKQHNCIYNTKSVEQVNFLSTNNILVIIPCVIDTILVSYNNTITLFLSTFYVSVLAAMIVMIEPFYGFSHIFFHFVLIVQTCYLSLCNIKQ